MEDKVKHNNCIESLKEESMDINTEWGWKLTEAIIRLRHTPKTSPHIA